MMVPTVFLMTCLLSADLARAHVLQVIQGGLDTLEDVTAALIDDFAFMDQPLEVEDDGALPLVVSHGMGDSCFNPGMAQITELAGKRLGAYSVCIGDGDSQPEDTINGFFMNMNKQVDYLHSKVKADPKLANGFAAMGLSQGNLIIRGYIEKYNEPPVKAFLSIHGPLSGTGSLPRCSPKGLAGVLCKKMTDLVGDLAYTSKIQELVCQANMLKDPTEMEQYLKTNIFLPLMNNEVAHPDSAKFKANFEKLEKLILVKARGDTMIFPPESEWFGFFEDGSFDKVLSMNETAVFKSNAFGLKTLYDAGKVSFEESEGNHLQFSMSDLYGWIDKHLK